MKVHVVICLCLIFYPAVFSKSVKVIGGSAADIKEVPYIASFRYSDGELFCAGAIISKKHILTAAHCFRKIDFLYEINICIGTNKLKGCSGTVHKAKHIETYPDFTGNITETSIMHHDIAVVVLFTCMKFNEFQNKIELPTMDALPGTIAVFSGWGSTVYPMFKPSNVLQKAYTTIISNAECSLTYQFSIHAEQLCAYEKDGVGACEGDSGGPLVSNDELVGIASFVNPCAKGFPDVYTRVYLYLDFIKYVMDLERKKC